MDYILNFEILDKTSLPMVGGKNASLGEMIKSGIRVPPGFAVTTDSYLNFITETGIKDKIFEILSHMQPDDMDALNKASAEIQDLINNTSMDDEVQSAIERGYSQLCEKCAIKDLILNPRLCYEIQIAVGSHGKSGWDANAGLDHFS